MIAWALSFAAAAALVYGVRFAGRPPSLAQSVIKTLSVAALALVSARAGLPWLLTAGLLLGALGDACLSRAGDRAFLGGLGAFALSHLAYIALFLSTPDSSLMVFARPVPLLLAAAIATVVFWTAWRLWPVTGRLRAPVMGYAGIIAAMGFAALIIGPPVLWGALLFLVSDAVLAWQIFLWPAGSVAQRAAPRLVWATYWPAQFTFLISYLAAAPGGVPAA